MSDTGLVIIAALVIGAAWIIFRLVVTEQSRRRDRELFGIEPVDLLNYQAGQRDDLPDAYWQARIDNGEMKRAQDFVREERAKAAYADEANEPEVPADVAEYLASLDDEPDDDKGRGSR